MKIRNHFFLSWIFKSLIFILLASTNSFAANEITAISIVTDYRPGVSVLHGLTKPTNALQAKKSLSKKSVH